MDANHDGSIDWEEFKRAVSKPTTLEAWAQSIPLWQATHSTLDQIFLCARIPRHLHAPLTGPNIGPDYGMLATHVRFFNEIENIYDIKGSALSSTAPARLWRQVLADAIPYHAGVEPLKAVCDMTPAAVAAVCRAVSEAAEKLLLREVDTLKQAYDKMERRQDKTSQAAKFQVATVRLRRKAGKIWR